MGAGLMTMNRADTLAYISGTFTRLATATSTPLTDDYAGFKGAMDSAFTLLGYDVAATIPDDVVDDFLLLVNYLALKRMQVNAGADVDIRLGSTGGQKTSSQYMTNLKILMDQAVYDMVVAGLDVSAATGMLFGYLQLDILEPSTNTGGQ